LENENELDLPTYSSRDIEVLENSGKEIDRSWWTKEHFFANAQVLHFDKAPRRCSCLQMIAQGQLSSSIRVSKTMGLVERAETSEPFWLLEEYTPHHPD
jgi:hypothetical protein